MLYVRVPRDRIGVLIGKHGEVKRKIEEETGVRLIIDSESGEVTIDDSGADPDKALRALNVVKAIARGFSPERAFRLLQDGVYLEIIDIRDFAGKSRNRRIRLRGRVIGRKGRSRKTIEEMSGAYVSVYGDTVAIIGDPLQIDLASRAVEKLLQGSKHSTAYRYIERRKRELEFMELEGG
ncbi:MAG: RNA-processing protein [Thermoplasmata archaeon]|nr:RNA-processing protein [Thermoplasmata archaeon]RLF27541.1 MAG: RNA-processing protein [Thermoplasmata archaeon]HDJ26756.1 RNA-processing protein [Aciduliprofundum sp.]